MARKEKLFAIETEGRDKGKTFLLTEMSASQAEAWAARVLLALMSSNVDIPEGFDQLGMAGLAELGMKAISGLKWDVAEPLLKEMFGCIQIVVDPRRATATTRALQGTDGDYDIEEVATRLQLRKELWSLHMGFLEAVAPSIHEKVRAAAVSRKSTTKA